MFRLLSKKADGFDYIEGANSMNATPAKLIERFEALRAGAGGGEWQTG